MADLPSLRVADYVLWWTTPEKCGLQAVCEDCGSHRVHHPAIQPCTPERHVCNKRNWRYVPNNADVGSPTSLDIARDMLDQLGITERRDWQARQSGAALLERAVRHFLAADGLTIRQNTRLSEFDQYRHLCGRPDDRVNLDVTVSRKTLLLAALELKTTLRADRARGAKRNLHAVTTKHDGSRPPIAAVITGEPLPGRLAKCVAEMGDVHAVYHVDRTALAKAVESAGHVGQQYQEWRQIEPHIRDFSDLVASLRTATT